MAAGGNVVDYHGCDFFPERWFDLVIVLQTDNTVLWNRLEKRYTSVLGDCSECKESPDLAMSLLNAHMRRGYKENKIQENVECEIMQMIVEEAQESYQPEVVQVLPSNSVEDMESNVERTAAWVTAWQASHQ